MKKRKKIMTINSLSEVPQFRSEDEERKYWETHDLSYKLCEKLSDPKINREARKLQKRLRMTDRRR
jgi:hypothetical protein